MKHHTNEVRNQPLGFQPPALTIIVAEAAGNPDFTATLGALEVACVGILTEVVLVRPPGPPPIRGFESLDIREVASPIESLVPDRWGIGVREAKGANFACLTSELLVRPEWAATLLSAMTTQVGGTGAAIALDASASITAGAIYLIRFQAFLPSDEGGAWRLDNIPGDGAVYSREAVMAYPELLAHGFWEAEFHRRFRNEGREMRYWNKPLSSYRTSLGLGDAMKIRARHASGYGWTRVVEHGEPAIRLLLAAPVVPIVLVARIFRRAGRSRGMLRHAILSLPAVLVLAVAWAWGEATGAWSARRAR